jgi:outer membrane murein-binding lipoprotein Lpp
VGAFEKLLRELADRVATLEAKLEEHRAVVQPALENAVRALTKHAEGEAKHPEASRGKGGAK